MVTLSGMTAEFKFFRPQAQQVNLAGDFNGWRNGELRMARGEDGYWRAAVTLLPGTFKFRYCADGVWFTDYAAFGVEAGPFGYDSIVHVTAPAARKARTHRPMPDAVLRHPGRTEKTIAQAAGTSSFRGVEERLQPRQLVG